MLRHFIELFANFESIPINILCEPLLKQIEISQYHAASFNVFDFEFFNIVAQHRKLTLSTALILLDSLGKIAITSVFYQISSIQIINGLMKRFQGELFEHWKDNFRQILQTIVNIEARLKVHRNHLRQEENNFFNRLALRNKKQKVDQDPAGSRLSDQEYLHVRTNLRLAVNLLEKVYLQKDPEINHELKNQLSDTYITIQQTLKVESQAIAYMLKYYTKKLDVLIEDRMMQNPQVLSAIRSPYSKEIAQSNNLGLSPSRKSVDIYGPQKKLNLVNGAPAHDPDRLQQVSVALSLNPQGAKRFVQKSQLYDYLNWEEDWEVKQYEQFLKLHKKFFKELYKSYVNANVAKKYLNVQKSTFEENEKQSEQITATNLVKIIKDFKIDNGMSQFLLKEEVVKLVKQINLHILKQPGDIQKLNFEGFQHFLLQYANLIWHQDKNQKAYQLVEKLVNMMREQPLFQKLNLVMNQVETIDRKQVEVLMSLQEKYVENEDYQNKNFKLKEDTIKVVQFSVPESIPYTESQKIVVELLDDFLTKAFGFHFLEPITVEYQKKQVIPQLVSRRKVSVPPVQMYQQTRGIHNSLPLSQSSKLSSEQQIAKENFLKMKQKKQESQIRDSSVNQDDYSTDPKEQFQAQAINRRAAKFGHAIQMTVIDAQSLYDKQQMYECAEVLVEVLTAVEQGKKALRLDFTPYKLYDLRKRRNIEKSPETISEQSQSHDPEEKDRKRQAVNDFMERHKYFLEQQKKDKEVEEEMKKLEIQKLESKKKKQQEDKAAFQEDQKAVINAKRMEKLQQKSQEDQKLKQEKQRKKAEANENLKNLVEKHIQDIKQLEEEKAGQRSNQENNKETQNIKQKVMADRWSNIHKDKLSQANQKKQQERESFLNFTRGDQLQTLLNQKYRRGLYIKFEQCLKISQKTTGVTQAGWLEWLRQSGVIQKVSPKLLINIHTSQIREMQEVQDYSDIVQDDAKTAGAVPGELELNYPGFVIGLIKIANIGKNQFRADEEQKSQVKIKEKGDYEEYSLDDFSEADIENFFKFLRVAGKQDK